MDKMREGKIRGILNNVYQDANGVPNFNATLANGTVDIALREIMALFPQPLDEGKVARLMHDEYEKQAKIAGWKTQESCQVEFDDLPEANKKVMYAAASAICTTFGKVEGKWIKFNPRAVNLPKERRYVLLQIEEDKSLGMPPSVAIGYLRRRNNRNNFFVIPGFGRNFIVTHWSDCLGDNFYAPLWKGKQV